MSGLVAGIFVVILAVIFFAIKGTFQSDDYSTSPSTQSTCNYSDWRAVTPPTSSQLIEEWRRKSSHILNGFVSEYSSIVSMSFSDLTTAHRAKENSLRLYDSYWDITDEYNSKIKASYGDQGLWDMAKLNLKSFFDQNSGIEFWGTSKAGQISPRQQFDNKMLSCIKSRFPSYRYEEAVCNEITEYIRKNGSVMRCKLLKENFAHGYGASTSSCYDMLVKKGILIEEKRGNRYFVHVLK